MSASRGTAVVELTVSSLLVVGLVFLIILVAYFYFAKVTISNTGYDALICVAQRQPRSICSDRARDVLKGRLPWGRLDRIQLKESRGWFRVDINWTLINDHKVAYSKSLRY